LRVAENSGAGIRKVRPERTAAAMGLPSPGRLPHSPTIGTLIGVTDANPLPEPYLKSSQPDDDPKRSS
jgi:hypothetical protein